MKRLQRIALVLIFSCTVLSHAATASAQTMPLCGTIVGTVVLATNAELTCDVQCVNAPGTPCIQFGADHIWLRLNGFKITGPADPPTNCVPADPTLVGFVPEDGIRTNGHDFVQILGPGLVQRFRRHGIEVVDSTKATVRHVTSHHNCFSGLILTRTNDSDIEENTSVRNAIGSGASPTSFPCGGTCINSSHDNRFRRNEYAGNGSIATGGTPRGPLPNDFGIGLVGNSSGNVIEENGVGGNVNGVWVGPLTKNNLIRRNVIAGNPPVQLSPSIATPVGVDIRDLTPAGATIFEENLCITYEGTAAPSPCAFYNGVLDPLYIFPKFSGHRNTSLGSSKSQ
jgi:hypothetical protein